MPLTFHVATFIYPIDCMSLGHSTCDSGPRQEVVITMKAHLLWTAVLTLTLGLPSAAWAQRRMPHADANGLGVEVGFFTPRQTGMGTGPDIEGTLEHYIDARDSVRLDVGWMRAQQNNDSNKSVRQVRVAGDLV